MLTKNRPITLPMRQSPDVMGVTIDFGGAPDHGRWRAMKLTITLLSPKTKTNREIKWTRKRFENQFGDYESEWFSRQRDSYERVVKIRLDAWELKED